MRGVDGTSHSVKKEKKKQKNKQRVTNTKLQQSKYIIRYYAIPVQLNTEQCFFNYLLRNKLPNELCEIFFLFKGFLITNAYFC